MTRSEKKASRTEHNILDVPRSSPFLNVQYHVRTRHRRLWTECARSDPDRLRIELSQACCPLLSPAVQSQVLSPSAITLPDRWARLSRPSGGVYGMLGSEADQFHEQRKRGRGEEDGDKYEGNLGDRDPERGGAASISWTRRSCIIKRPCERSFMSGSAAEEDFHRTASGVSGAYRAQPCSTSAPPARSCCKSDPRKSPLPSRCGAIIKRARDCLSVSAIQASLFILAHQHPGGVRAEVDHRTTWRFGRTHTHIGRSTSSGFYVFALHTYA